MLDAKRILDQLVNSGIGGGLAGGLAGGALANILSGKKARKFAGSALKVGGVALIGGVAYKAWQHYQRSQNGSGTAAVGNERAFIPPPDDATETTSLNLLLARAMIAAAKADGQIDANENQVILEQINSLALPPDDRAFLFEEYAQPLDIGALVRDVHSPAHAAEVYTASLLMLDPPSPPEQIYLDNLMRQMSMDPGLAAEIRATVQAERVAA